MNKVLWLIEVDEGLYTTKDERLRPILAHLFDGLEILTVDQLDKGAATTSAHSIEFKIQKK